MGTEIQPKLLNPSKRGLIIPSRPQFLSVLSQIWINLNIQKISCISSCYSKVVYRNVQWWTMIFLCDPYIMSHLYYYCQNYVDLLYSHIRRHGHSLSWSIVSKYWLMLAWPNFIWTFTQIIVITCYYSVFIKFTFTVRWDYFNKISSCLNIFITQNLCCYEKQEVMISIWPLPTSITAVCQVYCLGLKLLMMICTRTQKIKIQKHFQLIYSNILLQFITVGYSTAEGNTQTSSTQVLRKYKRFSRQWKLRLWSSDTTYFQKLKIWNITIGDVQLMKNTITKCTGYYYHQKLQSRHNNSCTGGVGLIPSEIQHQMGLLYQLLMTDTEHCWNDLWKGKNQCDRRRNCCSATLSPT